MKQKKVMIFAVCAALCLTVTGWEYLREREIPDYKVERVEAGSAEEEVSLDYQLADGEKGSVKLAVPGVTYTHEEVVSMLSAAQKQLDTLILGRNTSFLEIRSDLMLITQIPGSPVSVSWNSDHMEVIDYEGRLGKDIPVKGIQVQLEAELSLQEESEVVRRTVMVYPSLKEGGTAAELLNLAKQENEQKEGRDYYLPRSYEGQGIVWSRHPVYVGLQLLMLTILLGVASRVMEKRRIQEKEAKRQEELLQDYPEIISKLKLLMSAGLSIRKSFERISADYEKIQKMRRVPKREAYEVITRICREMLSGVEEIKAYEHLGQYCNCQSYKTLSTILTQNLRRGSSGIIQLMEQEAQAAFDNRKRQAKVRGEKAETKLLFPMVVMLGIVMVIIMVPSYLSFMNG
ncbi:MAG: type II secretion system F family protein [Lachnospiraceae bacterium]|nr:type II secretion system F family protein [Lachnospiraceae bacterium]